MLKNKFQKKHFLVGFIIFLIAFAVGAFVEVIEFLATLLFKDNIVGSYANNASDLIANGLGALAGGIFALRHFKKKK